MPSLEELQEQRRQLPVQGGGWFTRREFRHLPKILTPDESLKAVASGLMDGMTWLIVTTNKRIIFLNKGWVFRFKQKEIPLAQITSIVQTKGMALGEIHLWIAATKKEIRNVRRKFIAEFVRATNQAVEEFNSRSNMQSNSGGVAGVSVADELKKLADLKDAGILTDIEFEMKKKRLLNPQ